MAQPALPASGNASAETELYFNSATLDQQIVRRATAAGKLQSL
jgi:hypothetical protein